jgi:hypothetical protein
MDRVDVVELEPLVLDVARACDEVNRDVLRNPKVHITIGDARETLLTGQDRYDLIASEPSNPFRAGVASLFTREYYAAARDRLTDDGVFLQWVQMYELDARTFRTVYATLASIFPHVEAWEASGSDVVLVGAKRPLSYTPQTLAARIQSEPFKTAIRVAWRAVDLEGFLSHFLANEGFATYLAHSDQAEINTDDRNVVEFGFARTVGSSESLLAEMRNVARRAGHGRPSFAGNAPSIDWGAANTAWVGHQMAERHFSGVSIEGTRDEQARQAALLYYFRDSDTAAARTTWRQQARPPAGPTEIAMVADLEAEQGSDASLDLIEQLRVYQSGEADALLATLRFRQGRLGEAATALEAAFDSFRAEPWALARYKERAIALAAAAAGRDPEVASRMFEALKAPFSVRAFQDEQLATRATLTRFLRFEQSCRDALTALEPHVPWNKNLLALRRDCYQATGDPRVATAERELREFVSREPMPLGAAQKP